MGSPGLRNALLITIAVVFTVTLAVMAGPPLIERHDGDIIAALGDGFVNPFAASYAVDALLSFVVLLIWVLHERAALGVRHGWIALLLGLIGAVLGLAAYLLIRERQLRTEPATATGGPAGDR